MADPVLIITDAGRAAAVTAAANEVAVDITQVAIGTGQWTPTAAATALQTELKRLPATGSQKSTPTSVTVGFQDASADAYAIYEVGFYLSDGTLLAIYASNDTLVAEKSAPLRLLWGLTLVLSSLPADSVSVTASANFIPPNAGETVAGIAELATQAEVDSGLDNLRIVTAEKLWGLMMEGPLLMELLWQKRFFNAIYPGNEIYDYFVNNSCASYQTGSSRADGSFAATVLGHPTGSGAALTDFKFQIAKYELARFDARKRSSWRCAIQLSNAAQWFGLSVILRLYGAELLIDGGRNISVGLQDSGSYTSTGVTLNDGHHVFTTEVADGYVWVSLNGVIIWQGGTLPNTGTLPKNDTNAGSTRFMAFSLHGTVTTAQPSGSSIGLILKYVEASIAP